MNNSINKTKAYIVYAKRTPTGSYAGGLSTIRPDDLLAQLFVDFKSQHKFDLKEIDDTIIGCANQAGEDNRNIARMSLLLASYPHEIPATTINRLCGSSLDAIIDAWGRICSGVADALLVGGVESMSRSPYVLSKGLNAFDRNQQMYDTTLGWRFPNKKMQEFFPLLSMGETAEEVAKQEKISRVDQDEFAFYSHQKALKSIEQGLFKEEILPISVAKSKKETITILNDEGPRAQTSMDKLAALKPAFRENGTVTAGNSSTLNDGASLVFLVSESFLKRHNLQPMVEVIGASTKGVHPNIMGLGPVQAIATLEKKFDIKRNQFDAIELNEAFAAQALGCIRKLNLDPQIVNSRGGAIALGHALGNSGTRITTTLIHRMLADKNSKLGLASMCIGVGQGIAVAFKKA